MGLDTGELSRVTSGSLFGDVRQPSSSLFGEPVLLDAVAFCTSDRGLVAGLDRWVEAPLAKSRASGFSFRAECAANSSIRAVFETRPDGTERRFALQSSLSCADVLPDHGLSGALFVGMFDGCD